VSEEEIRNEDFYRNEVADCDGTGEEVCFPEHYPTAVLAGMVNVVDVVPSERFSQWKSLPQGAAAEGRCNGSDFYFLCEDQKRLASPFPMPGQHKLCSSTGQRQREPCTVSSHASSYPLVFWAMPSSGSSSRRRMRTKKG